MYWMVWQPMTTYRSNNRCSIIMVMGKALGDGTSPMYGYLYYSFLTLSDVCGVSYGAPASLPYMHVIIITRHVELILSHEVYKLST